MDLKKSVFYISKIDLKGTIMYTMVVFAGAVLAMYIDRLITGATTIDVSTITGLLIFSILSNLLRFIFPKKKLSRTQLFICMGIHLSAIIALGLAVATLMDWITWAEPIRIIFFITQIATVYIVLSVINTRRTKKLADELNEKLKERYKR